MYTGVLVTWILKLIVIEKRVSSSHGWIIKSAGILAYWYSYWNEGVFYLDISIYFEDVILLMSMLANMCHHWKSELMLLVKNMSVNRLDNNVTYISCANISNQIFKCISRSWSCSAKIGSDWSSYAIYYSQFAVIYVYLLQRGKYIA